MATYTESQIRAAIATVITTAAPNAKVFPWWSLGHEVAEWPGQLIPESGSDAGKVHGYVITRTGTEGERKNPQCVSRSFSYDIWAFHFYKEDSTSASNSDLTFNTELDAICDAFITASTLPAELQRVEEEPSFRLDLDIFGGELLHYATGRLVVAQL